MEKYRKLPKEREPINSDEIRVTSMGRVMNYVGYATRLLNGDDRDVPLRCITIKATGNAIARAVTMTEVLKRRFKGLHQITKCGSTTITDVYEPTEEGLDKVTEDRVVSFLEITLSRDPLDENDPGYQPPLDESLVKEKRADDFVRPSGFRPGYMRGNSMYRGGRSSRGYRGGFRGAFRGRGRGRGGGPGAAALHAAPQQAAGTNNNTAAAPGEGGGYVEDQYAVGQDCANGEFAYGDGSADAIQSSVAGGMPQAGGGAAPGTGYPGRGGRGRGRGYRSNPRGSSFRGAPMRMDQ